MRTPTGWTRFPRVRRPAYVSDGVLKLPDYVYHFVNTTRAELGETGYPQRRRIGSSILNHALAGGVAFNRKDQGLHRCSHA